MTTTAPPSAPGNTTPAVATPLSPSGRHLWRAARAPLIILLVVLVAAAAVALLRGVPRSGYLDPRAANPAGGRALARLLGNRGVHVVVASTVTSAQRATGPHALLMVTRPDYFRRSALRELAGLPGDRLLVDPTGPALTALAPSMTKGAAAPSRVRSPGCHWPAATRSGGALTGGPRIGVPAGGHRCYGGTVTSTTTGGRTVTVVGDGQAFTNRRLDADGNAALAMNLAGADATLVWLCPRSVQSGSARASAPQPLTAVLPRSVKLAALQLAVAVALLALWRVRRHGAVVAEPLPVVVRAAETVEGHAMLYRSRRARGRAADALRAAALARLLPRLGLPVDADAAAVSAAVTARVGGDPAHHAAVLYGAPPGDDAALIALADELDALEEQVRSG